jgi:hypothetical protein
MSNNRELLQQVEAEAAEIRRELALREYDQLRGQERDIMQSRFQVWAGAITLLSLLSVVPGYAIAIGPLIVAAMACYVRGGETTLRTIRPYLREFEARYQYQGYERYYDCLEIKSHGSSAKAVRDTLLLCELLMAAIVALRLWEGRPPLVEIVLVSTLTILITGVALRATWVWMKTPPKPRPRQQNTPDQSLQQQPSQQDQEKGEQCHDPAM